MTTKILALAAAVTAAVTLSGCSTLPDGERTYNDKISRAYNIASNFDYEELSDSTAPKGYEGDGSFLLEGASFAASLNSASNINGFLPGISGWGAVGLGLLGGAITAAGEQAQPQNNTGYVGYLDATQAKDEIEARKKMTQQIGKVLAKSAQDLLPNAKITYRGDFAWKESLLLHDTYGLVYDVVDPKIGCMYSKNLGAKGDNSCAFVLTAQPVKKVDRIHPMFGNADRPHYKLVHHKFGKMINIDKRLSDRMDVIKWFTNASKYMPEKMFIYVPQMENLEKKEMPRMVIEKDRVDLFIKPPKKK